MSDLGYDNHGELAAALAKAQASFPVIKRDKQVTVKSERTGKSYSFKYAPLDAILDATRKPLADNGLAITQLLDGPDLVTMLLHSSGGSLTGRMPLPNNGTVQDLGSAITYLRRYSIQALLGIAAEEDDDGNRASGNDATFGVPTEPKTNADGSLIGTAVKQAKQTTDFSLRLSDVAPGSYLGFRLASGAGAGVICEVRGKLAEALAPFEADVIGQRVQVWGSFIDYEPPVVKHAYRAFRVERIQTPTFVLPSDEGHSSEGGATSSAEPAAETPGSTSEPLAKEAAGNETGADATGAAEAPAPTDAELDSLPLFEQDAA